MSKKELVLLPPSQISNCLLAILAPERIAGLGQTP